MPKDPKGEKARGLFRFGSKGIFPSQAIVTSSLFWSKDVRAAVR
jgi:hypothetical protein